MQLINKKQFLTLDFIKEVFNYGLIYYPELIPKHCNNFIVLIRQYNNAYRKLLPIYLSKNNYYVLR